MPNEEGTVLELRIDYTLLSIDGSGEEIKVHGATAYVPAIYAAWKPNYAYTYIFKISDNTNGWTSTNSEDPAGLFPITFDAVVLDPIDATTEQTTITTVATPSITTYQKGHLYTDGPEYEAGDEDIFVQVMIDGTLQGDLDTNGQLYTLSYVTGSLKDIDKVTEADVLSALCIQTSAADADPIVGRNELELTEATFAADFEEIPAMDGNNITINEGEAASFDATEGKYAFVYDTQTYSPLYLSSAPTDFPTGYYTDAACTTAATGEYDEDGTYYKQSSYIYSAETMGSTQPTDWAASYFKDPNGVTPVSDWNSTTDPGKTYYKRYAVSHKIYGVKVITVK